MEKSEQYQSSIAEEEQINGVFPKKKEVINEKVQLKFATINQIRLLEHSSEVSNDRFMQNRPLLFSNQELVGPTSMHFVSEGLKNEFQIQNKKEDGTHILESKPDRYIINLGFSNIRRQNNLIVKVKNLKKKALMQLTNIFPDQMSNLAKFKYTFSLHQNNLLVKVLLQLQGKFKVWKQMDVPLQENKFTFQIYEYNNEHTDIRINDYSFHLLLKMPYYESSNYCLIHEDKAEIERIEFTSKIYKKQISSKQTYCTNECQLI